MYATAPTKTDHHPRSSGPPYGEQFTKVADAYSALAHSHQLAGPVKLILLAEVDVRADLYAKAHDQGKRHVAVRIHDRQQPNPPASPTPMAPELQTTYNHARNLLDERHAALLTYARQHNLALTYHTPGPDRDRHGHPTPWYRLLELDLDRPQPWPRTQLHVSLYNSPGRPDHNTIYLWAYVEDLATDTRVVDIGEHIAPEHLPDRLAHALAAMAPAMDRNALLDPYEATKTRMGTEYYWEFKLEDGAPVWSTELDGGDHSAEFYPEEGTGLLYDPTGEVLASADQEPGEDPHSVLRRLEQAYRELTQPN